MGKNKKVRQFPVSSGITNQRYDANVILTVCAGSPAVFGSRVETSEPYYPSYTDEYLLLDIELEMPDRDLSNPSLIPSYSHKMMKIKAEYWGISIGKNVGLCAKYTTCMGGNEMPVRRLILYRKNEARKNSGTGVPLFCNAIDQISNRSLGKLVRDSAPVSVTRTMSSTRMYPSLGKNILGSEQKIMPGCRIRSDS